MHNVVFSLIQTSQNRRKELLRFINSLNVQKDINLSQIQLIFIDQGDNKDVFKTLNTNINLTYVPYHHCSLSHARNIGLTYVRGKYIGFPDDDCWYEPDSLKKILTILEDEKYWGVTCKSTNEDGVLISKFPNKSTEISITNRCGAISITMFFKYINGVYFDENLGVGSPYNLGSGEETDYMLTLMLKYNYNIWYESDIIIHHPLQVDKYNKKFLLKKFYSYARGGGYLLQKHNFPLSYKIRIFLRPFIGIFVNALLCRKYESQKSWYNLKGRVEGYNFTLK